MLRRIRRIMGTFGRNESLRARELYRIFEDVHDVGIPRVELGSGACDAASTCVMPPPRDTIR
jgi:hypothetical protein